MHKFSSRTNFSMENQGKQEEVFGGLGPLPVAQQSALPIVIKKLQEEIRKAQEDQQRSQEEES